MIPLCRMMIHRSCRIGEFYVQQSTHVAIRRSYYSFVNSLGLPRYNDLDNDDKGDVSGDAKLRQDSDMFVFQLNLLVCTSMYTRLR